MVLSSKYTWNPNWTSIFEGQPPKTRSFPTKTRVIWVPDIYIYIHIFVEWYTHISHTSYMCIFNIHTPLTCNTMDTQNCQISGKGGVSSKSPVLVYWISTVYIHTCMHAVVFIILKTSNFRRVLTRWYRVPIQHPFWAQSPPKLEDALYTRMLYIAFETCFRTNMRTIDGCEYEIYSWANASDFTTICHTQMEDFPTFQSMVSACLVS